MDIQALRADIFREIEARTGQSRRLFPKPAEDFNVGQGALLIWRDELHRHSSLTLPVPSPRFMYCKATFDEMVMKMRTGAIEANDPDGSHVIRYVEWGDPDNTDVLLCVHGLIRNGRDFDFLARDLSSDYRVICPDLAGRGKSDWLTRKEFYTAGRWDLHRSDLLTLIDTLSLEKVNYLGTSMGGLIGILLASNGHLSSLILNDVGPFLPHALTSKSVVALAYDPSAPSLAELEPIVKQMLNGIGELSADTWHHIVQHSARLKDNGRFGLAHDFGLADPVRNRPPVDVDLWSAWDAITCPTLVIRGELSKHLSRETLQEMQSRGRDVQSIEIPGCGHFPSLMIPDQISAVKNWLLSIRQPARLGIVNATQ